MKFMYYVKFSELHAKPKIGITQSLIWVFISDSEDAAIQQALDVGKMPVVLEKFILSEYW